MSVKKETGAWKEDTSQALVLLSEWREKPEKEVFRKIIWNVHRMFKKIVLSISQESGKIGTVMKSDKIIGD